MQKLGSSILIACLALAVVTASVAAPFQNGSFEIGTDPGASFLTLPNGDNTDITGWTVIQGDIDYIGGYWQPAQGLRSLDLIGDQFKGGVQQTFDTIPGATYIVSFEMSGNPAGGPTIRPLAVTVAGNTQNFTFDITGATLTNMNWTPHQFTFVATGASETIQFVSDLSADPAGCCYGAALDNVQIVGLPNLTIGKSHVGNFTQGQVGATYTLTVTNVGAGPTSGAVTVTEIPPVGLTVTGLSGPGWICTLGTLSCTRGDALAAGASYAGITVTVDVAANAPALVVNQATVAGGGDIDPSNNTASDSTTVVQVADLTITKTHAGNFTQGQVGATYTITVSNSGAGPTVGTVTVVDTLPAGLTATALAGPGWGCVLGTLTCTRSDALAAGLSYPAITLTVTVANNAPALVTNTATVSGGGEINNGNDSASDPTTVVQVADLTITKTHTGNFTQGQVGATYTITVSNSGAGPTVGTVTVTDALPPSLTATSFAGTGWTCAPLPTLSCTRSDALAPAASYPVLTLTVGVSASAPASVVNSATVSGGGSPSATANDTTVITQIAALAITKTHSGNFTQGQSGAIYTITVSNTGAGPTVGTVTVTDTLPPSLTATSFAGTGWTCAPLPTLSCTRSDALAPGASYPVLTLTVNVSPSAPASVVNSATASGGGSSSSPTANDTATIVQIAGLTIAKSHVGNFAQGQVGATYTITVANGGSGPTVGTVTVTDTLPPSLTATALAGTGWTCAPLPTLSCTRSDALAAAASYPALTLTVNVSASAPASIVNSATVSGGGSPASVTANDSTVVQGGATATAIPTLHPLALLLLTLLVAVGALRARRR